MTTYSRRTLLSSAAVGGLLTTLPAYAWRTGKAKKETKTDVLVIGSGLSGIISAVSALDNGAEVLLIDKAERGLRGGNSRVCLGSFVMPENDSEEARRAFVEDVAKKSLGGGRTDLYAVLGDNIRTDIAWLESMGAGFEKWMRSDPWRLGVRIASPGQYRGMPKLLETLHGVFEKKGGKALYRTKAKALLLDDRGAVCGCRVQTGRDSKTFSPRPSFSVRAATAPTVRCLKPHIRAEPVFLFEGIPGSRATALRLRQKSVPRRAAWRASNRSISPSSTAAPRGTARPRAPCLMVSASICRVSAS